jgi:hypothetical protein
LAQTHRSTRRKSGRHTAIHDNLISSPPQVQNLLGGEQRG